MNLKGSRKTDNWWGDGGGRGGGGGWRVGGGGWGDGGSILPSVNKIESTTDSASNKLLHYQ